MIRNIFVGASVLAVLAVAGGQAHGQSLNDVLVLAYRGNPDLTYQRAQVDSARALVEGARAPGLPQAVINGAAGQSRLSLDQGSGASDQNEVDSTLQLNVSQVLYAGGRISQDTRRAKATAQASEFDLIQAEQLVLGQAITAYVDILRDEAILSARNENVEALIKQSTGVTARLREGEVTKTDVAQTQARLAQARSGAQAALANLAVSRAAFTRIVGQSPESLAPAPPLPGLPLSGQEAELAAEHDTPSVKAAQLRRSASEAAIRRAAAERLPYVTLDATAGQDRDRLSAGVSGLADSVQREDSYGLRVNVRVPLFQGGATAAGVRQARALERGAQASEDSALRQARETAANAWNRMQAADAIIDSSTEQARAADVAYRGGEYELNAGLRSTFDVLDLQQDVLSARIAVASAQRDAYVARVNLLQAVGRLTLNSLGVLSDEPSSAPTASAGSRSAQAARPGAIALAAATQFTPKSAPKSAPPAQVPVPAAPTAVAAVAVATPTQAALASTARPDRELTANLPALASTPAPLAMTAPAPAIGPAPLNPSRPALATASTLAAGPTSLLIPKTPTQSTEQTPISSSTLAARPAAFRPSVAAPDQPGSCALQAGAFGREDVARQARDGLELRLAPPPGAQWLIEPAQTKGQRTYRVVLAGLAGAEVARDLCDRLGRSAQACFVRLSRCANQGPQAGALQQAALTPPPAPRGTQP